MNFVVGGIKGLVTSISFKKKEPTQDLKQKFNVPENDICVHDFNCVLQDKILLQGNLYVYNTMICFHSVFNKHSIVGDEGTTIIIPYSKVIQIEKKKKLVFDNSIQFTTINDSYFFTSFISRNKAHDIICEYLEMYQRMLPKPNLQIQNNVVLNEQELSQIDNEDEWLKQAIYSIQNLENRDQMNRQNQGQNRQQYMIPQQNNHVEQGVQIQVQPQQYQNVVNQNQIKMEEELQQQRMDVEENKVNNNQLGDSQSNIQIDGDMQPLDLQKSVIKEFQDHFEVYKLLFEERENSIKQKIQKEFPSINYQEIIIRQMTARELFGIFFSNSIYKQEQQNKEYNCFFEYYIKEFLNGTNISISEIQVPPPEIYNSIYSNNYSQLVEYPEYSERHLSFTHPIPKPSAFLPKSIQCQMRENIYWSTPQSFILVRYLTLKGIPMASSFEPRVIYTIDEQDGNVRLRSGFQVYFKKKSSKEENEKTWNELKNIIFNVSEEYKRKRDANKLIVQQENQNFLKEFNVNEFEQYDEDFEEGVNQMQLKQSNQIANNVNIQQLPKLQPKDQEQYEKELSHVASQASNQACTIF